MDFEIRQAKRYIEQLSPELLASALNYLKTLVEQETQYYEIEKMSLREVVKIITPILVDYQVKRAAFFGSFARGEATERSDLDLVVELMPGASALGYFGLQEDLEKLLFRGVDVITFDSVQKAEEKMKKRHQKIYPLPHTNFSRILQIKREQNRCK